MQSYDRAIKSGINSFENDDVNFFCGTIYLQRYKGATMAFLTIGSVRHNSCSGVSAAPVAAAPRLRSLMSHGNSSQCNRNRSLRVSSIRSPSSSSSTMFLWSVTNEDFHRIL